MKLSCKFENMWDKPIRKFVLKNKIGKQNYFGS